MISDEEADRLIGEVAEFYENPRMVEMKRELDRIVEPFRETLGADAVREILEHMAREQAHQLGMSDEEFEAQHAAIHALVRLRKISGGTR